jgi:hypothetical protein
MYDATSPPSMVLPKHSVTRRRAFSVHRMPLSFLLDKLDAPLLSGVTDARREHSLRC